MKLFRDKNRGPKVKSEDVVIPEAYLEYEREAEEKKRMEAREAERRAQEAVEKSEAIIEAEAEIDEFKARLEELMNNRPSVDEMDTPLSDAVEKGAAVGFEIKPTAKKASEKTQKASQDGASKSAAQKAKKKRNNPYPPHFMGFLAAIVVAVATFVVMLGPLMAIDKVDINDLKYISDDKVLEMAGLPIGQNLFLYGASKAEDAMSDYPYVEDVKISRHLPHRLEIHITERQPAGVLLNNGNYLQFSKDGILLDNTKSLSNQNLPLITGFKMEDVPSPGGTFKDNVRFNDILRIINACDNDLLTMLQEINIKDRNNILAYTSQGIEIRIGSIKNIEVRMATLNDIINQVILSGIIDEPIEAIDIRYEKSPVVVLEGYSNVDVSKFVDEEPDEKSDRESAGDSTDGDASQRESVEGDGGEQSGSADTNATASTDTAQ